MLCLWAALCALWLNQILRSTDLNAPLQPAFQDQDEILASPFTILREAISNRAFPAASVAVTQAGKLVALKSFGTFVFEEDREGAPPVGKKVWGNTEIERPPNVPSQWRNVLTGEQLSGPLMLAECFNELPAAVLCATAMSLGG